MDLDLRKLRYFVAVAEHLNFSRAAEELHIAQPVLSRQIRAFEQELKVQLFVRDKRATELTASGRQLLADARPLLAAAAGARRRAVLAAREKGVFTVGFMPGLMVTGAVRALSGRHPELSVTVLRTGWDDQVEVLRDGRADVGYVRLPVDTRGLRVEPLLTEPRVVVLPADHRLAGKDSLCLADLGAETLLQDPAAVPEWSGAAAAPLRSWTVEEKLENVAAGRGIVVLPLSTARFYTRPDVTSVRVDDLADNQVCLAWDSARRTPLIAEFVAVAQAHRDTVAG
ncbi:LysR family transcriptional regulator [Actinophytocola sp. KF-1]